MVICLCKGVSDSKIRFLVQNGATTLKEVMATSHAGKDCGSCIGAVKSLIEKTCEELDECQGCSDLEPAANE